MAHLPCSELLMRGLPPNRGGVAATEPKSCSLSDIDGGNDARSGPPRAAPSAAAVAATERYTGVRRESCHGSPACTFVRSRSWLKGLRTCTQGLHKRSRPQRNPKRAHLVTQPLHHMPVCSTSSTKSARTAEAQKCARLLQRRREDATWFMRVAIPTF